jgi:hypothetical protein
MKQRVLDAAKHEASPTRAEHRAKAIRSLVVATAVALFILFVTGGPELGHRPGILLASTALILAGLAIAITLLALRGFGKSMTGAPTDILIGAAIFSAPVLWLVELGARLIWIPTVVRPASLVSTSICHACTLAMAAAPLYAMIRLRRHSDFVHPRAMGAALGAAAGAWGAVLIDLHCASNNMLHIAVGHILPTVVLVTIGAFFGAKSLAASSR